MFLFILAAVVLLVALPCIVIGNKTVDDDELTIPLRGVGVVLASIAGLLILLSCMYTQDPGEVYVIRGPGGNIASVDTSSGFGLTAPWNTRIGFDIRNQKIEMFSNEGGEGEDGARISSPTSEGTDVGVSVTVRYSIQSDCVENIYTQYKSENNLRDRALLPGVRDEVRKATSKYSVFTIKQSRGELTTDIVEALNVRWEDELCVSVDDIDLGALTLDDQTEAALRTVVDRQSQVEAARADLDRALIEAEVVKTEALAAQESDQVRRCGATITTEQREVGGEVTDFEVIRPVPIESCQNVLTSEVLTQNYIEALRDIGAHDNLVVVSDDVNSILNLQPGAAGG